MRLLLILFVSSVCYGLPVGNPGEPSFLKCSPIPEIRWVIPLGNTPVLKPLTLKGGYYGDFVFRPEMTTHAAIVALNFLRIAEIFGTAGKTTFEHQGNASWSIGGRLMSPIFQCFALGVEGQRFRSGTIDVSQIGGGLAYIKEVPWLCSEVSPYIAIKNMRSDITSREWGLALGATLIIAEAIDCTVEGRFFDERAVFVTSQLRF